LSDLTRNIEREAKGLRKVITSRNHARDMQQANSDITATLLKRSDRSSVTDTPVES